jgi:hypothetical protein
MFYDLFSWDKTASLVYTNDIKVLIDIIVRQLADLSPGEAVSQLYFVLSFIALQLIKEPLVCTSRGLGAEWKCD